MDNENQINEQPQQNIEVKESFNLFKMDGALSRSGFFIILTILFAYAIVLGAIILFIYLNLDINKYIPLFVFIVFFGAISIAYISIIGYAKRLYDIIGNKQKALLYIIITFIGMMALSVIPILKYLGCILSLTILITLLVKKGQLIN